MPQLTNALPQDITLSDREQIQYLLGNPPSWMMRYGITAFAFFFIFLLATSYFIRYPDVLDAKITLTTSNPPIRVMAQTGGRITHLLVADHQSVEQGQILGVFENPANWEDVLRLESWLANHNTVQDMDMLPSDLKLGNLQPDYSVCYQHSKDYQYFITNQHTSARVAGLTRQIEQLQKMNDNLLRQKNIMEQEFALQTKEQNRQLKLHEQKVISDLEFEKSESSWLQQKRQIEMAEASILQNQMQIKQFQNQINDLGINKSDNQNDKELTLSEDLQRLRSAVQEWKQANLISAPIKGAVSLSKIWSPQQNVSAGEEILTVVPETLPGEHPCIVGKTSIAGQNMGKLRSGCRALVRLDAFPAPQYGSLEGSVANISAIPQQEGYSIDIALPNELTTTYHKAIPFRQEMPGQVRIITEERRLIERIFDRLTDLLKNR